MTQYEIRVKCPISISLRGIFEHGLRPPILPTYSLGNATEVAFKNFKVEIEGANRHDMKLTRPTRAGIVVERPEPTEAKPQGMCLDKGYDYDEVCTILKEFGFTAHIRSRGNEVKALARESGCLWFDCFAGCRVIRIGT